MRSLLRWRVLRDADPGVIEARDRPKGEGTPGTASWTANLAFVAGFVDTCGFVALFGLFTAHVTGNFVLLGASVAQARPGVLGKMLALPVFVLAVAGTRLYLLRRTASGRGVRELLLAQLVLLAAFLGAGLAAMPIVTADAPLPLLAGMCAVAAMGIQNAASRTVFVALSPTTVMTGNVTQLVLDSMDWLNLSPGDEARAAAGARIRRNWPPVMAFALGALGAGLGYAHLGFWSALLPIAVLGFAVIRSPNL